MSDPKSGRFMEADAEVRAPSWLPPRREGQGASPPTKGSRVTPFMGMDSGGGPIAGDVRPIDWSAGVANLNGTSPPASGGEAGPEAQENATLRKQLEQAQAELATLRASVEAQVSDAQQARGQFVRAAADLCVVRAETLSGIEGQLLELAVLVAQTIIEDEVAGRPELHQMLVEAALEHLAGERRVALRCAPEAFDAIVDNLGGSEVELRGIQVAIAVDPDLRGLGCVIECESRRVDGRVSERLASVRCSFLAENRKRSEVVE